MKKLAAVILLVILVGCASMRTLYVHPDPAKNTHAVWEHDRYICEQDAFAEARNAGSPDNVFIISAAEDRCLIERFGWRKQ